MTHFWAFVGVSAVVIVTPGQDTALTIRNTLLGGRRSGMLTAAGVSGGQAMWALATSAGVAAVLQASEPAFVAVKLAGAAYLVYLGLQTLVPALRPRESKTRTSLRGRSLRQGLVSNLGNPKMAIFFTSLLPQFATSFGELLGLGLVFASLTLVWLTAYAFAVAKAGDLLRGSRVRRVVDGITGAALLGLGLRLAAEQR
ncbi:MAG: LysE family translocator [Actinobacteria bacterium]|nr:MAG: LysE family translocator [Actinomycetota bacterium]